MKFTDLKEEALELWNSGEYESHLSLAEYLYSKYDLVGNVDYSRRTLSVWIAKQIIDKEVVLENVKLAKQKQKAQDLNRIERKSFREFARVENAISEYSQEIVKLLKCQAKSIFSKMNIVDCGIVDGGVGVVHLTDLHGNELIDLEHNQYNTSVMSRRLKKQISESLAYFKFRGVSKVVFLAGGDLLNSDRRLDELLSATTNRAKATVLVSHLITQAILHIREHYEVDIVSVLGNESRAKQEMSFSNNVISDNYDFSIMSMCREVIEASGVDGIKFHSIDKMEEVVNIGDQNWLVAHDVSKFTDKQDKTQSTIGRYGLIGKNIDFIVGGHIHAHRGTDISCRAGSLAGSNTYNEHALNLQGRASAVCYVVKGKERFYQYIDCQQADNDGYEFDSRLEAYNIKSDDKTRVRHEIIRIVV